jgi:hypothetical protein
MKKSVMIFLVVNACFLSCAFAGGRRLGEMPAPRLVAPSDDVDLSGTSQLEFRWGMETGANVNHYDFRLYRGPQTYEKNLILKKDVPVNEHSLLLDSSQFQPGETYSWSLRYVGARKSASSYSVFKIKTP